MSKISIIGDCHFGSSFSLGQTDPTTQLNTRLLDFAKTFNWVVDEHWRLGSRVLIFTGDLLESRNPPTSIINTFSRCLKRAIDKGFDTTIMSGNHDITRASDTTTIDIFGLLGVKGVSVFTDFGAKQFDDFSLVLLPYKDRKQLKATTNEEAGQIVKDHITRLTKGLQEPYIAIPHYILESPMTGANMEEFSIHEAVLPLNTFDGVSAVFGGHVHGSEVLKRRNPVIAYVGSMEKNTYGERNQTKSSILVDTKDPENFRLIQHPTRSLFDIELDYSDKVYKAELSNRIIHGLEEYAKTNELEDAIVRVSLKIKDIDAYYINQERIRNFVMNKGVNNLSAIQITTSASRQLRDQAITEDVNSKKAFGAFVKNLNESETTKKRLTKIADQIIEEVDGE